MSPIENLLRDTIGLDAASVGSGLIQRIVRLRMKTLGLSRIEEYRRLIETSAEEWRTLVESVVITETWFFRDHDAFAAFTRLVSEDWLPANPTGQLRILSVPCASGEEPYSMAMALMDLRLPDKRFVIDAVDISVQALAKAQHGIYGKNSFRCQDLKFRTRFFEQVKEGFALKPSVCSHVRFHHGNILSDDFLPGAAPYDIIFCRNLLIYFDAVTRRKTLVKLDRLLAQSGVLFVGPAEQPLVFDHGFISAGIPMAFACRKASQRDGQSTQRPRSRSRAPTLRRLRPTIPDSSNGNGVPPLVNGSALKHQDDLEAARCLADAGRLEEATRVCEDHLRNHGASAQAYYLLGVIRDAAGEGGAIECYRKALYLQPDHYEALLQMALLSQKNGDSARARSFKRRAQRLRARN